MQGHVSQKTSSSRYFDEAGITGALRTQCTAEGVFLKRSLGAHSFPLMREVLSLPVTWNTGSCWVQVEFPPRLVRGTFVTLRTKLMTHELCGGHRKSQLKG